MFSAIFIFCVIVHPLRSFWLNEFPGLVGIPGTAQVAGLENAAKFSDRLARATPAGTNGFAIVLIN
jgi:hypothetical protein